MYVNKHAIGRCCKKWFDDYDSSPPFSLLRLLYIRLTSGLLHWWLCGLVCSVLLSTDLFLWKSVLKNWLCRKGIDARSKALHCLPSYKKIQVGWWAPLAEWCLWVGHKWSESHGLQLISYVTKICQAMISLKHSWGERCWPVAHTMLLITGDSFCFLEML